MKARSIFALVAVLCLAGRTQAGQVDKAKLVELAELPTIEVLFFFDFSSSFGFGFGEMPDRTAEIARLQKELKADLSDDERYVIMGRLESMEGHQKEAQEAFAKAVAFCRQKVREHPEDTHWRVRLGDALLWIGETKEAEPLLRRAVKEAPNEWRAWLALADCMGALSLQAIFGNKRVSFDEKSIVSALRELKPTEEQTQEMHRLHQEALRNYDRAIRLAPRKEFKPYFHRILSNGNHAVVEAGFRTMKGEKVHLATAYLAPECLADLRQIASLSPDDPKAIGTAMFWEVMSYAFQHRLKKKGEAISSAEDCTAPSRSLADALPAESGKFVRWSLERLEQLMTHPNKSAAATASEILGEWLMSTLFLSESLGMPPPDSAHREDTREKALTYLRRAIQLDPTRERAWDFLTVFLSDKRPKEAVAVARERIGVKDNAHNRFFLAKAYDHDHQFAKAAAELRAGLKNDPKDLYCRLGLVAWTLRHFDGQSLKEAGEELKSILPRIGEEKKEELYLSYCLLGGIYYALIDHPEMAREGFQRVLKHKKGDRAATRALGALGERLGPADQQIAIDYLKKIDGHVFRKDKQAESPVERIDLNCREVTDDDLFVLTAFPQLHELNLTSSAITDAGIANLAGLGELRSLNLDGTKITDTALLPLKVLRDLKYLSLKNTKVTKQGENELRKAMPKLEVYR